jgi:5-formyltetrahydrofolate cyclo-ligase
LNSFKPAELKFWQKYLETVPDRDQLVDDAKVSVSWAGDIRNADELLRLYLDGKKTAGSSLLADFEASGEAPPAPGNFWMILDSKGEPRCLVKTIRTETHIFSQVPAKIAVAEGEGDLSLNFWRKTHQEFFAPYLKTLGITDLNQAEIITEFFEVVFK